MANEAVLITETELPISVIVADGAGIEKGTILEMTDPRTGAANNGTGDIVIGIAAAEKILSDGIVSIPCYQGGIFDMTVNAGAGVTLGAHVATSGANLIRDATEAEIAAGKSLGIALETGAASEVIQVKVKI